MRETGEEPNQPDILPYIYSSAFWIMKRSRWANRFCHSLQDARTLTHCVCASTFTNTLTTASMPKDLPSL